MRMDENSEKERRVETSLTGQEDGAGDEEIVKKGASKSRRRKCYRNIRNRKHQDGTGKEPISHNARGREKMRTAGGNLKTEVSMERWEYKQAIAGATADFSSCYLVMKGRKKRQENSLRDCRMGD